MLYFNQCEVKGNRNDVDKERYSICTSYYEAYWNTYEAYWKLNKLEKDKSHWCKV